MSTEFLSTLLICFMTLSFQFIAGNDIEKTSKVFFNEDQIITQVLGSSRNIVYPQFYDLEKKRKKVSDPLSSSTLVLRAANFTYYLELQLNEDLSEVPIQVDDGFETSVIYNNRCHFHGKIINKPTGLVALSACSGDGKLHGILMMEERIYFIGPGYRTRKTNRKYDHYLQEYSNENSEFCGINNAKNAKSLMQYPTNFYEYENDRVKRATLTSTRKVIEVAIFVDSELYKRIESTSIIDARRATVRRVLGIMNQVQLIYNYSSLLTKFKIVVVKLQILKSSQGSPSPENGDIDKYLDNFCIWQSKLNSREGTDGHWDHAIMLTGRDLFKESRGKRNPKVLGLAWVNGMCRNNYSCTLNEGTSFEAAFVIAHEIAHNLGVMHDGSGNNCDRNKYIMSDKTGPGKVHWSVCSNAYIRNFFGSGNGKCLTDDALPPNKSFDLDSRFLPGMRYSLSDQCTLALGSGFTPHKSNKAPFNNVCRELWCASGSWAKPAHPALEGSPCADGKVCLEGLCRSSQLLRTSTEVKNKNSSRRIIATDMVRQRGITEENGILRKIQDTVMKAIKDLG